MKHLTTIITALLLSGCVTTKPNPRYVGFEMKQPAMEILLVGCEETRISFVPANTATFTEYLQDVVIDGEGWVMSATSSYFHKKHILVSHNAKLIDALTNKGEVNVSFAGDEYQVDFSGFGEAFDKFKHKCSQ